MVKSVNMSGSAPLSTRAGHGLAKILGIKIQETEPPIREDFPGGSHDIFVEKQPTTGEFLHELAPTGHDVLRYLQSLFPFLSWIGHYNMQWLLGDIVAGVTIGAIVVPQGMAYAKLTTLDVQYGLYSSFMGVLMYWLFGTSKDVSIGPIAVMSTITGRVVIDLSTDFPNTPPHVIASGFAVISGVVILALGLVRCGWLIDLIPLVSLSAFVTGSALTIASTQLPAILGITNVSNREEPFRIFIGSMKNLPTAHGPDAAVGLSALFLLYFVRHMCKVAAGRHPQNQRAIFFLSTLRSVFVILLYTMISWLANRTHPEEPSFAILMRVPRGFQATGVPAINADLVTKYVGYLPVAIIVLLLEHIAVAKSFGRVNNYTINPSQEMVAIGMTNILGPFLGAFPTTGSFSRTAIQSKAGCRTPFTGVIAALVVLLAIYLLPPVFFYIPNGALAAVIIHAVGDLIIAPNNLYQFWRISPLEVFIFFIGVFITVFSSIENGIYTTVGISIFILLFRSLKARGSFLGRVRVHSVLGDHVITDDARDMPELSKSYSTSNLSLIPTASAGSVSTAAGLTRNVFLPLDNGDGSNPEISIESPYPGIFIYRFSEGFNFPNAAHTLEHLAQFILAHTRRSRADTYARPGDRPWNHPGPKKGSATARMHLPTLKAVILDFSSVNNVDVTSVQQLVDMRNQLDRYAAPEVVEWHLACIQNRWAKRALVSAGFGYSTQRAGPDGINHRWQGVFSFTEIVERSMGGAVMGSGEVRDQNAASAQARVDEEKAVETVEEEAVKVPGIPGVTHLEVRKVAVHGLNRPFFHVDLTSALQSAIANAEAAREIQAISPSSD